jgi:hypothetical protein
VLKAIRTDLRDVVEAAAGELAVGLALGDHQQDWGHCIGAFA